MQTEIQKLIDKPELLKEVLKLDALDEKIHSLLPEFEFRMQYKVEPAGRWNEPRFAAWCDADLVPASGIFSHLLRKCRLSTFSQGIGYDENGYHCWFDLCLDYEHFNGGSNSMNLATFIFSAGEWTMRDYKGETKR